MQVHRVVVPGSRVESWTVLGEEGAPVAAVELWLAYLSNIGRSPNTVKAYAFLCRSRHNIPYADRWLMPCVC